ncbi:YhjD/YihY/BrkB family envelope integrity protein [Bradyrhizobium sp. AUGA SZCCT0160]|uniref:YhjD/YihY/BrkB family envelope integrity protein n=1 Tax=Bradyrhizobium sp. AUGA SZCCT0160 TaxID=2807662 RepID=UPI001BA8E277|nr:YihY/virulence factor BrkB family protein [Bradyrhizobium sp. AUGA SZCCT0160]
MRYLGVFAGKILLAVLSTVVSLAIFTLLFTAIYKVLPDTAIPWRELVLGAFVTAVLFAGGKSLIGIYLGRGAQFALRRRRRADRPHVLDLLFGADLPRRRRAHQASAPADRRPRDALNRA